MWEESYAAATLPAQNLERARTFYADRLGLTPFSEDPVGLNFVVGWTHFRLFRTLNSASGSHTQLALMTANLDQLVAQLRARGVVFERYDEHKLKTIDGVADLGYARAAWFKDSEGNLLGVVEQAPPSRTGFAFLANPTPVVSSADGDEVSNTAPMH